MKTIYIILSFCAGLLLGYLLFPSHMGLEPPSDLLTDYDREIYEIDSSRQANMDSLQQQNNSLSKALTASNYSLANHKKILVAERRKVFSLIDKLKIRTDSNATDSLKDQIVATSLLTDSIIKQYDYKDSLMQQVVAIRDSQIVINDRSYYDLLNLMEDQQKREQQLTADLTTALKQNKRIRFQNRLLSAGILFVSGIITTTQILKTKN